MSESTRTAQQHQSLSLQEPIIKKPVTSVEQNTSKSWLRTVQIVRGDTLSRKYGVTIQAIKEANGLTGDTIYADKKLVVP